MTDAKKTEAKKSEPKPATSTSTSERTVSLKVLLITAGVGIALALVTYLIGLFSGRAAMEEQAQAHADALAEQQQELAQARDALATERARGNLLRARAAMYRAASDLDRRNFGLANKAIEEAGKALEATEAAPLGIEPEALAQVQSEIEVLRVDVAVDLEEQRTRLLGTAARLDRLIERKQEAAERAAP